MTTRDSIIQRADELIRDRGYNAFSFSDISGALGIRNASIHYYFPAKSDLGVAVVRYHLAALEQFIAGSAEKNAVTKLKTFLSMYANTHAENRVCIVGSLASDVRSVDPELGSELKQFVDRVTNWLTEILRQGRTEQTFHFPTDARTKALSIAATMLASLQLARITGENDLKKIEAGILKELKTK